MNQDKDCGFGKCQYRDCPKWAIVKLNKIALCLDHYIKGLKGIGRVVKHIQKIFAQ